MVLTEYKRCVLSILLFNKCFHLFVFTDPIVKEQGRMSSMSGHTSPTPVSSSGQIGGRLVSPLLNTYTCS